MLGFTCKSTSVTASVTARETRLPAPHELAAEGLGSRPLALLRWHSVASSNTAIRNKSQRDRSRFTHSFIELECDPVLGLAMASVAPRSTTLGLKGTKGQPHKLRSFACVKPSVSRTVVSAQQQDGSAETSTSGRSEATVASSRKVPNSCRG